MTATLTFTSSYPPSSAQPPHDVTNALERAAVARRLTTARDRRALAAAVARLDLLGPRDWRARVDVDRLGMTCWLSCVLGQVFGSYDLGVNRLYGERVTERRGLPSWRDDASGYAAFDGGFPRELWVDYLTATRFADLDAS